MYIYIYINKSLVWPLALFLSNDNNSYNRVLELERRGRNRVNNNNISLSIFPLFIQTLDGADNNNET